MATRGFWLLGACPAPAGTREQKATEQSEEVQLSWRHPVGHLEIKQENTYN